MAFFICAKQICARMEAGTRKGRDGVVAIETSMRAFFWPFGRGGIGMGEKFFSCEVYEAANKLTAIGALMMAFNEDVTDLSENEIHAIGILLNETGMKLSKWNKSKEEQFQKEKEDDLEPVIKNRFKQHLGLKKQTNGAVLFLLFEGKDHYQLWFDDAYLVSQLMDLPLSMAYGGIPQCAIRMNERDKCIGLITGISRTAAVCEETKDQKASEINTPIYATVLTPEAGNVAVAAH